MSLASLESTINGAFEARDTVSTTTKGEVRDAVDHAVGDHNGGIRAVRAELIQRILDLQCLRRQYGNAKTLCFTRHRARLQLHERN